MYQQADELEPGKSGWEKNTKSCVHHLQVTLSCVNVTWLSIWLISLKLAWISLKIFKGQKIVQEKRTLDASSKMGHVGAMAAGHGC